MPDDSCAQGHAKRTLFYEDLPDGGQRRHWICTRCLICASDPPSSAN
ncbi:MAG TPA: hypothetical protein VGG75_38600 [Trebonia sp.]